MNRRVIVYKNEYHDSVTLMSLSSKISRMDGVEDFAIVMGTEMNKGLLRFNGYESTEIDNAKDSDLIIAVKGDSEKACDAMVEFIRGSLSSNSDKKGSNREISPKRIDSALKELDGANIAVISVPGKYAAREAGLALDNGLHVMLFSDNVPVEKELELKKKGRELGLLVMGPDCGTSIINNKGLCFANKVRSGNIGLVAASGTGLQEVTVLIDRFGGGISQAIGVGGRDLSREIGGIMMMEGIKALNCDPETEVIVLISKPPAAEIEDRILQLLKEIDKKVVICFLDGTPDKIEASGFHFSSSLEDTARKAVLLSGSAIPVDSGLAIGPRQVAEAQSRLSIEQKYVRGLFCGGTLCAEALSVFRKSGFEVYSNISKISSEKLENVYISRANTMLDLGDDEFTLGKPHPMIEPTIRLDRILQEAEDREVAVMLLDFELGFGSHEDPVGVTMTAIKKAREIAEKDGRSIIFVAYICGTKADKQHYEHQEHMLRDAGVIVAYSNYEAAKTAAAIAGRR